MKKMFFRILTIIALVTSFFLYASTVNISKAECGLISPAQQCLGANGSVLSNGSMCWFGMLPNSMSQTCCQTQNECVDICIRYQSSQDPNYQCDPYNTPTPAPSPENQYGISTSNTGVLVTDSSGTYCLDVARKAITPFTNCSTSLSNVCVRQGTSCPKRYTCDTSSFTCKEDSNGTSTSQYCCNGLANDSDRSSIFDPRCPGDKTGINTAIGCIHVLGSPETFLADILKWAVGIGSGIAFLLMLYAGFMIMTASGNPERLKAGQELLTSALAGLILLIFSIFILKFIGVDILGLGKFGFGGS